MKALKEPRKKINNRMASCQLASLGPVAGGVNGVNDNGNRKIYVSNVKPEVDPERLRLFFSKYGEIETGPLGFDSVTGKSRGFALFVYKNQEGFRKALEEPYKMFEGHKLHCQKATSEGKNKGQVVSGSVVGQQPVMPQMMGAVAGSQSFGVLNSGQFGLNSMYGGMFSNPNLGFLAANPLYTPGVLGQVGGAPSGLGGYYAGAPQGLNIGGDNTASPMLPGLGLQNAYSKKNVGSAAGLGAGSASGSRSQGAGGSVSGYPYHLWYDLIDYIWLCFMYTSTNISLFCECFAVVLFNYAGCDLKLKWVIYTIRSRQNMLSYCVLVLVCILDPNP